MDDMAHPQAGALSEGADVLGDDAAVPSGRRTARLTELIPRLVPGSCGATTTVWDGGDEPPTAATHPDLAELVCVQLREDDGPIPTALRTQEPVHAADLLHDSRWPCYRASALGTGIRASTTFPFRRDGVTVTVTLYHLRPGGLEGVAEGPSVILGKLLTDTIARDRRYRRALAAVEQLDVALRSRTVVDQACGILMHLMDCDADAAFEVLRRASQHGNRKLSELARAVVATRGAVGVSAPDAGTRAPCAPC
ncbi:GAF and ANTAR domain-containing protein [Streptomyces sp. C36]|uniref:GAF and ANTAR domain-containing protein n=1 Tax=Streptomyces sp. C36 TaxID=3237122 RepID=UPI0034C69CE8